MIKYSARLRAIRSARRATAFLDRGFVRGHSVCVMLFEEQQRRVDTSANAVAVRIQEIRALAAGPLQHAVFDADFRSEKPLILACVAVADDVAPFVEDGAVRSLPMNMLRALENHLGTIAEGLSRIQNITSGKQDVRPDRVAEVSTALLTAYNEATHHITGVVGFLALRSPRLQAQLHRAESVVAEAQTSLEEMNRIKKAADAQLAAIKKTAATAAVAQHELNFHTTATEHRTAAGSWLIACAVIASLFVSAVIVSVAYFSVDERTTAFTPYVIQLLISKAVILSVVYYALTVSLRNYRVHRHLTVVNEHRRNALKTFETFAAAAKDEPTKAAVLLETTKCIFAPAASGYTAPDDDVAPTKFLELIKSAKA